MSLLFTHTLEGAMEPSDDQAASFNWCMSLYMPWVPPDVTAETICDTFAALEIGHVKFVDLQCPEKRARHWQATLYFDRWFYTNATLTLQKRLHHAAEDEAIAIQVSPTERWYVVRNQFQTQSLYKAVRKRLQYVQQQQAYHREALAKLQTTWDNYAATLAEPEKALQYVAAKCALAVLDEADNVKTLVAALHALDTELENDDTAFSSFQASKYCEGCYNLLRGQGGQNQLEHTCWA
jgi:hypothetical protein